MDADGPLMEQPAVPVVDLAPGGAKRSSVVCEV